ncbi:MAG: ABC transporter substrate-binding protein, partial [Devosia sp.]|nr:ABC transporter substrate-binding protein [Devosia sp.]
MRRILAGGVAVLALMTAGIAQAEPVKIGVITTLSGGGAGLGIDMRDAFQLAIKQSGNSEIELVVEDDAQKPELAVQIAEKMIQSDKVDLMTGIIWSNLAMAVVPNTVAQDVIYLSPNAGPSALAGANCHPNYFNVAYQNDNFHEAMGEYDNKDYKKTFILAPNYPAGKDALTGFKRYYKGELAGEVYTQVGQTDYAAEIAEIRASGADSVYFFLPGGMGIAFMKQYAQSGVTIPVTGPGFSFSQDVLPAIGDAALGVKNAGTWAKYLDNPANKAFVEAFQKEYNRLPSIYA